MSWEVRGFAPGDAGAVYAVIQDAILEGGAADYAAPARSAWAGRIPSAAILAERLSGQDAVVSLVDAAVTGVMSRQGDLIDLAYVAPAHMGRGLAARMHAVLIGRARAEGVARLHTHASHSARPFFARQGWRKIAAQEVAIGDQILGNFRMELSL